MKQKIHILTLLLTLPLWSWADPTEITSLGSIGSSGDYIIKNDIDASGFTTSIATFTGTLTAQAKADGTFPVISGLTVPIFTTATGATISNLMLKNVSISQDGNVGAIACTADGATRIYNCGILSNDAAYTDTSTVASTNGYSCGSLVGVLGGTARVVNCFSYAKITKGGSAGSSYYVGGLVGNNSVTSNQNSLNTVVVNCMFYGEINTTTCARYAPVYGNNSINNNSATGINPYDYFVATAKFQSSLANVDAYKRSWPADVEYLTRFEYYRSILNSNRQLMAWWVSGNIADTALIAKWVLDPSIAPYPVLKKWGKYPSIINPDPIQTWDPEANAGSGAWQSRQAASPYRGKSHGSLSITVDPGAHAATGITSTTVTRTITDMDTLNHDYGYHKVQLPYYNEIFGNPSSSDHDTRYGGNYKDYVVTGWKIVGMNHTGRHPFVANWESGYNFADRQCTGKDLYDTSGRVFAQGGFFYVPEGVTSITIEAYWGKAVYLHNTGHYLDRVNITASSGNRTVGSPFASTGALTSTFQGKTVWDAWHTAVTKLDAATKSGSGDNTKLSLTVYDQAIVLLSNFQIRNENGAVGYDIDSKWHPYTIMSIDQDLDNEPDYCFEFQFRKDFNRPGIQPIRFDFLPVPELGMAVRHSTQQNTIGIFVPQGHFEITETSFMHTTQFEYDANITRIPSPVILNGGHFEQIVVRYGPQNNTQYFLMGGHFRMLRFTPGAHTNKGNSAKVRLCAVNAVGGEYPEFYLSGIYRPDITPESVAKQGNPHCYTNGGYFGLIAGAGYDKILGDITFEIDHSIIDEFYGGGINGSKPVGGSIDVTVDHSFVGKYCGGPKVGTMTAGKTVTTHATGTHFGRYYGGGNGGTSYYREQQQDGNVALPNADSAGWANYGYKTFNPLNTRPGVTKSYEGTGDNKGYHALFEFECFVESNGLGQNPTVRSYRHWAQFGTTSTGNITNVLDSCIIDSNFYGGGNLGNVSGTVTSTLANTEVKGYVCGGGFSGKIEPFRIHDKTQTQFPYIDKAGVMQNPNGKFQYVKNTDDTDRWYTWSDASGHNTNNPTFQGEDGKWYCYTTVSLSGLGAVSGDVTLTLKGSTTIGTETSPGVLKEGTGNVYGGGDESAVNGNTTVILEGGAQVLGNVYGGGNRGVVGGTSSVTIQTP